jgi:hypothetical protein
MKKVVFLIIALLAVSLVAFAQDTTSTTSASITGIEVTLALVAGFVLGTVIHYVVHLKKALYPSAGFFEKWSDTFKNFAPNLTAWFKDEPWGSINTYFSGGIITGVAIIAKIGINVDVSTINIYAIAAAVAGGFISDSVLNHSATLKDYTLATTATGK